MTKKSIKIFSVFLVVFAGVTCFIINKQQITHKIDVFFGIKKGTAKWWHTHSSEESKRKNVFICYYKALPFEYQDSVFHVKLVFDEVYTEWCHWYENTDSLETTCLFYKNSETVKDQQLIGVYDTSKCIIGISTILKSNYHDFEGDDIYLYHGDSLVYIKEFSSMVSANEGCYPLMYWESICGYWPELFVGRYEYETKMFGYNTPVFGEFRDTIIIPVYSSFEYNRRCGYDDSVRLPFGEIVFIKRQ